MNIRLQFVSIGLLYCSCVPLSSFAILNPNPHYQDIDNWNVTLINESRERIFFSVKDQSLWDSQQIKEDFIEPCSEYKSTSSYTMRSLYKDQPVQPGFLAYNLTGSYNGTITLIANDPDLADKLPVQLLNAQAQSGSADWIVGSADLPVCKPNQVTGCVLVGFYVPKNIATFEYPADTTHVLRMASTYYSPSNEAYVVFQPKDKNHACPLHMNALRAAITHNLPAVIAAHSKDIIYINTHKTFAEMHPGSDFNALSGGMYVSGWGVGLTETLPTPETLTDNPVFIPEGDTRNLKMHEIHTASSILRNCSPITQDLSTSGFTQSETLSSSTTTKSDWFQEFDVSTSGQMTIPLPIPVLVTVTVGGKFQRGGSEEKTYTNTITNTVTAPAQTIEVPPLTEAVAYWSLKKWSGESDFSFYAPIDDQALFPFSLSGVMVRSEDEWHHLGTVQQHQHAQILPKELLATNLYSLLQPTEDSELPVGIKKLVDKEGNSRLYMSGAATVKGEALGDLEVSVSVQQLDDHCNKIETPATIKHYPVKAHIEPER